MLNKTIQLYKDAFSGHPREVWSIALVTFINRVGTMVLPFLTIYLTTELGYSLKEAGVLAGAFGFGSLAGTFLGGKLSDRIGNEKVIIGSLSISGLLLVMIQYATTFYPLFALIFTTALFGEAYRPAQMALIARFVPRNQTGRTMAVIRMSINLGFSAAPAFGGLVAVGLGYKWLFWIDGVTCVLAAVYFGWVSRDWSSIEAAKVAAEPPKVTAVKSPLPLRNPAFVKFLIATLLMGFGFIQWFHSVPVFMKMDLGFDERFIGLIMAGNGLIITLIEMPLIHAIEKGGKNRLSIILGLAMIGLSFLALMLPWPLVAAIGAILLMTFGEIAYLPFNSSTALNLSPADQRGNYMGWYSMAWSVAHISAPTIGLAFADKFGFTWFWLLVAIVVGFSLLLNLRDFDKTETATELPLVESA